MAGTSERRFPGLSQLSSRHRRTCHDVNARMHQRQRGFPHRRPCRHYVVHEDHGITTAMTPHSEGPRDRCASICAPKALVPSSGALVDEEGRDAQSWSRPR